MEKEQCAVYVVAYAALAVVVVAAASIVAAGPEAFDLCALATGCDALQ